MYPINWSSLLEVSWMVYIVGVYAAAHIREIIQYTNLYNKWKAITEVEFLLHTHMQMHAGHIQHNKDERTQFFRKIYLSLYLKGFERVVCERELETEQRLQHIDPPPTLLAITAFLSRSPGLLNRGTGAQPLLGHGSHSSIFSPTDLNFLSPGLYNNLTSTYFLRASQFALNSTSRQSRSPPDIFDRMHLLFTQVHFFFWQLGRGQYATFWLLDAIT